MPKVKVKNRKRLRLHYPLRSGKGNDDPTHRSYQYRYRQTKRGRVPATPEDIQPLLERQREQDEPAEETPPE